MWKTWLTIKNTIESQENDTNLDKVGFIEGIELVQNNYADD